MKRWREFLEDYDIQLTGKDLVQITAGAIVVCVILWVMMAAVGAWQPV